MIKAKGFAAVSATTPLAPYAFERRDPKENDVVIDIKFCGVCHSGIHMTRDEWKFGSVYPMVPGHKIAGVARDVRSKVKKYKVGDRVGVGRMVDSCRSCINCKRELENYCIPESTLTYSSPERDGSGSPPLCWHHYLLTTTPLERRFQENGGSPKPGRFGSYGSQDRRWHGGRCYGDLLLRQEALGRQDIRRAQLP